MTSEAKPTPGPWFVANDDADDCPPHKDSGLAMIETGRVSDYPIARLCEWNNVYLLAAAFDLFESLDAIMKKIRYDCCSPSDDLMYPFQFDSSWEELAVKADAAIAKAKGQS